MSFSSRLFNWWMKLPPADTYDIVVTRDLKIPMPDGAMLLADHYASRQRGKQPTILIRSPYGRRGVFGGLTARPYAERGYQVLIQSCRGTAHSEGEFVYARHERADGLATIEWIKQQEWFNGELAMIGASYLGFVQWAVAAEAGPELKALVPHVTTSDFNHFRFQGGSFTLETSLDWSTNMTMERLANLNLKTILETRTRARKLEQAYAHLPLQTADRVVIGQPSRSFQNNIAYAPEDDYWQAVDHSARLKDIAIPASFIAGWYDLFLFWQLKDYQALRDAGQQPHLLIGPWTHGDLRSAAAATRSGLAWLNAHIKGDTSGLREAPVRLYVMGTNEWRDFAAWPPAAQLERWYLQAGGGLAPTLPSSSEPDRYRYDPTDPTPAVGGNSLGLEKHMGAKDNRALEARADVLVYTSAALEHDLEVIGPLVADLYVRSSLEYTDFFTRLCVVEPSGKSINLCDGILRLTPGQPAPQADGSLHIHIEIWPTACHFQRGQRLRVQVSSGAHPRFARNPGSGEALATATTLLAAEQTLYHDPEHPSAIVLPVVTGS